MSDAAVARRSTVLAAGFGALAALGQLSQLLLTKAGKGVNYQHFTPLVATGIQHAAQALLAAQLIIVVIALGARRDQVLRIVRALVPGWRLPALLVLFAGTCAALSREPMDWVIEVAFAVIVQLTQLATVALAVSSLPQGAGDWITRLLGPRDDVVPAARDRLAFALAAWTVLVSYLLAVFCYERVPHIPDEVVYLLHARYFAAGMLTMPAPPVPEAFNLDLMTLEPARWFSPVPPGWPAMLSVGAKLGAPWLVDPLLAGMNVLLVSAVLREIYPRRTVRIVLLLLAASPWALFMAMNITTHTFAMTCALAAALAVARLRRGGNLLWAVLGGVMIGAVSLIRPLEGMAVALLMGLWSLGKGGHKVRPYTARVLGAAVLTISTIAMGALNFPYNRLLTGSPRIFPIMAYTDKVFGPGTNAMGFGPNRGLGWGLDPFPGHGLRDVIVNTMLNGFQVNIELLGWAGGALLAVWLLLSGKLRRGDGLMLAVIGMIVGLHAFYWFSGGPDFGARYWYLVLVPALALVARGLEEADDRLRAASIARDGPGVFGVAALSTILALAVFMPWRAIDKYHHYRGMRPDVRALAREHQFGRSIVLVRGNRHPDYHGAATFNPVDLQADAPIYVWDVSPEARARVLAAYPDRPVWILDGPTLTHGGYRVVGGPIAPAEAATRLSVAGQAPPLRP